MRTFYFLPGQQLTVARELLRCEPLKGPVFVGGDVNVSISQPKNEPEAELVAALMKLFARWEVDNIPQVAPSHWDRH
eukprot:4580910-Lingulodinium_polyedra.AAC.1